jgi:hypothetical protein
MPEDVLCRLARQVPLSAEEEIHAVFAAEDACFKKKRAEQANDPQVSGVLY